MNIEEKLKPLTDFLSMDDLLERLKFPRSYMAEPIEDIIPSIDIGNDGLILSRIALISKTYLCEVNITIPKTASNFDFILRESIKHCRFETWVHEIKEGDVVKASYEIAKMTFMHSLASGVRTSFTYAGHERDAWIEHLIKLFPISALSPG